MGKVLGGFEFHPQGLEQDWVDIVLQLFASEAEGALIGGRNLERGFVNILLDDLTANNKIPDSHDANEVRTSTFFIMRIISSAGS